MRRIVLFALLAAAGTAQAQTSVVPPAIEPGTRVRVETVSDRIVGELVTTVGDTLVIGTRRQRLTAGTDMKFLYEDVRVPRAAVERLSLGAGYEPRARAAARDGLWGALLGVGFVTASYLVFPAPDGEREERSKHVAQLRVDGGVTLFAVGALYGALHPHERWREVGAR